MSKEAGYDKYVDQGCKLFEEKDRSATKCMLGIGRIISEFIEHEEIKGYKKYGVAEGKATAAIAQLQKLFLARGHDYAEGYYSQALRTYTVLTPEQRTTSVKARVPFRDLVYLSGKKMDGRRDAIMEKVEAGGWEPYKNLSRREAGKKASRRVASRGDDADVVLPELPDEWTVDNMENYFLSLLSHSKRRFGTAPDKLAAAFDSARVRFNV